MSREIGLVLGEIVEDEVKAGRPMLSAVAVGVSGKPGPGFYALAKDYGKFAGQPHEEESFWHQERDAAYEVWRRPLRKPGQELSGNTTPKSLERETQNRSAISPTGPPGSSGKRTEVR